MANRLWLFGLFPSLSRCCLNTFPRTTFVPARSTLPSRESSIVGDSAKLPVVLTLEPFIIPFFDETTFVCASIWSAKSPESAIVRNPPTRQNMTSLCLLLLRLRPCAKTKRSWCRNHALWIKDRLHWLLSLWHRFPSDRLSARPLHRHAPRHKSPQTICLSRRLLHQLPLCSPFLRLCLPPTIRSLQQIVTLSLPPLRIGKKGKGSSSTSRYCAMPISKPSVLLKALSEPGFLQNTKNRIFYLDFFPHFKLAEYPGNSDSWGVDAFSYIPFTSFNFLQIYSDIFQDTFILRPFYETSSSYDRFVTLMKHFIVCATVPGGHAEYVHVIVHWCIPTGTLVPSTRYVLLCVKCPDVLFLIDRCLQLRDVIARIVFNCPLTSRWPT